MHLLVPSSFHSSAVGQLVDLAVTTVLIAWPTRMAVFVGPYIEPASRPCYRCLLDWLSLDRGSPPAETYLSNRNIDILAAELRRWHQRPSAYRGRIREVSVESVAARWHYILPRPNCPQCGGVGLPSDRRRPKLQRLVSPITGIVSSLTVTRRSRVWEASAEVAAPRNPQVPSGQIQSSSGLGTSRRDAVFACLLEAVERYSLIAQGSEAAVTASLQQLGDGVSSSALVYPFSEKQYRERDRWNRHFQGMPYIPPRLPADLPFDWSPCWSLHSARQAWVPSQIAYIGPAGTGDRFFYVADSTGCAAAPELPQAVLHGLLELVERDAVSIWWYNRVARPAVSVPSARALLSPLQRFLKSQGRRFCLLDITTDLWIPVFAGLSWNPRGRQVAVGFGCHPNPAVAARRALRELCQTSTGISAGRPERYAKGSPEHAFLSWSHNTCVFDHAHLRPTAQTIEVQPEFTDSPATELLAMTLRVLAKTGLEPWLVPLTRPELSIPAVRVLCGELRHPGHRFAPGRLYDVPLRLGWRNRRVEERDLNPVPCVF